MSDCSWPSDPMSHHRPWQLQREVAAPLPRAPAREVSPSDVRTEEPRKGRQAVVPVVIARNGEDVR